MSHSILQDGSSRFPVLHWTEGVEFEPQAQEQVLNLSTLKFIFKHIAIMPDVHWGKGCTIGTVMATKDAIIPSVVGVDLGCGMAAVRTTLTGDSLPVDLTGLRLAIERTVPVGQPLPGNNVAGSWDRNNLPDDITRAWYGCDRSDFGQNAMPNSLEARYQKLNFRGELEVNNKRYPSQQLGTLGGGNHFIEVCVDEENRVWIMLHSGSRNVGKRIADVFIERAAKAAERYMINLPDRDLGFLPRGIPDFDAYMDGLHFAQDYAATNRATMMARIVAAVQQELFAQPGHLLDPEEGSVVQCHHNYVSMEHHYGKNVLVTRKGAISARVGELGIIPTSMGRASYIVEGKGNRESFHSAPHGSGRRLGRKEAKRQISLDQFREEVRGVNTRIEPEFIEEAPSAYKNGAAVLAAADDLVSIKHVLKQVLCVKGK